MPKSLHWKPATRFQQNEALNLVSIPRLLRPWLQPDSFDNTPKHDEDEDWSHMAVPKGQTFERYVAGKYNKPSRRQNKIYLQPLGSVVDESWPDLNVLAAGCSAFYGLETILLPPITLAELEASGERPIRTRGAPYGGQLQMHASDVNANLKAVKPDDAFTLCAVTMIDLFQDSFNFLMGLAAHRSGVGVFSFFRHQPNEPECEFFHGSLERRPGDGDALLRHAYQLVTHELGHTFGLNHCVYFSCLMQGFNSLEEAQKRIPDLCPVCLRKLLWCSAAETRAGVVGRYERLHDFYRAHPRSFGRHYEWVCKRLGREPEPPEVPPEGVCEACEGDAEQETGS